MGAEGIIAALEMAAGILVLLVIVLILNLAELIVKLYLRLQHRRAARRRVKALLRCTPVEVVPELSPEQIQSLTLVRERLKKGKGF